MTAMMLVGCSSKDMNKMKEDVSTIVSEAKDNLNDMVDNATVSDGDGHIGENRQDETVMPTDDSVNMTEDKDGMFEDGGDVVDDPNASEDMTQVDEFI